MIQYFDRILVNNSIIDRDERPFPFRLAIDVSSEYKTILLSEFANDAERRQKARVRYALYLYHPSECFDIYRYQKNRCYSTNAFFENGI